jgi:hypothetical protein
MSRFPIDRDGPACHYEHASSETTNCTECGRVICPEHRSDREHCNHAYCLRCESKHGFQNNLCDRCQDELARTDETPCPADEVRKRKVAA